MAIEVAIRGQHPELAEQGIPSREVWPEYNLHGDVVNVLWPRLERDLVEFQFCVLDGDTRNRGRGLALRILTAMRDIAGQHGLEHLIAPVRPSWKERYPLTPIERYVTWRRGDGELLDPWMRGGRGPATATQESSTPEPEEARASQSGIRAGYKRWRCRGSNPGS